MPNNNRTNITEKLAVLQSYFHQQLPINIRKIEKLWDHYRRNKSAEPSTDLHTLYRLIHNIAGSGGSYGAVAVSTSALELERVVKKVVDEVKLNSLPTTEIFQKIDELITQLNQVSNEWNPTDIPVLAQTHSEPTQNIQRDTNNLIFIAEDDEIFASELILNLEQAGYTVQNFKDLNEFEIACNKDTPSAIIMDIIFKDSSVAGINVINNIKQLKHSEIPVIFISSRKDIEARLGAIRAGASRYFSKPINFKHLIFSLDNLTNQIEKTPSRVLVVDDDKKLLEFYQSVLENSSIVVKTISNPLATLPILAEFKPDVIVLDVYMPECSGSELAQIIRQDNFWAFTPIIFLSTESNLERQLDMMDIGGDDFLVKPISAEHLVSAVQIRTKRSRQNNKLNNDVKNALRENDFQLVTMNKHNIVSITNVAGTIISANDKFSAISGYHLEELIGQNHRILRSGKHPEVFYTELWQTISSGKVWHGTICNRKKNGDFYWVDSTIVPFIDFSGKPYKYVSVRTDITALRISEERLNRSQSFANIGTWDWDLVTSEIYCSERISSLFNFQKHDNYITYDRFLNAIYADDRLKVHEAIQICIEQNTKYNIEHRILKQDGSIHWMHQRGNTVRDNNNTAIHMLGVVQDITIRKFTELQLKESEQRTRLILESIGEGIYGLDINANVIFANPACCKMLGYSLEELIGKPLLSIIHHKTVDGSSYPREKCPVFLALLNGKTSNVNDEVFWHKNGSSFAVQYTCTPVINNKQRVGVVTVFQDITQRLIVEHALINAKTDAENTSFAKSQFIAKMSNELRSPMNAIMGFSQLLKINDNLPLEESQLENVDEIIKAGSHLIELIDEVQDLTKIELGNINLSLESVFLGDIIYESLQLIAPLAKKRDIEVSILENNTKITNKKLLSQHIFVRADYIYLQQVLMNLLTNAVKYNKNNGKIIISFEQLDLHIRINIKDTGIGLTEEQQSKLFTPFERLSASQTDIHGIGIGLLITKNIIERMNGKIGYSSKIKQGSNFWIDLPRDNSSKEINDPKKYNHLLTKKNIANTNKKYSILYIEDNPANLRLVIQLFSRSENVHMLSAHEPLLGLELAKQYIPNIILLDINLPGIDGYEVLQILRDSPLTKNIFIIALSANAMQKDIKRGLAAGFDHYVTKPIDVSCLLNTVESILSGLHNDKN